MQFDAGHGQPVKSDSSAGPFPRMNFCNRCGCNLAADHPIDRGDWRVALHGVEYKGEAFPTSPAEASMLHSLAAARGAPVSAAVLAERSGYEGIDPVNVVSVTLCRLRQRLKPPSRTIRHWRTAFDIKSPRREWLLSRIPVQGSSQCLAFPAMRKR